MASNTLGTILIELKAKTDAFERGMKSAKDLSFTTSSEIVGSLERIGKSLLNLKFNNLDQMGRSLGIVGGIAAATGVALATSLVAVAVETSKKMVEMGHDAEKAGMGIKEFTEFAYAAKRSGVDVDSFTASMSKLAKTALGAAQGNAQLQASLRLAGTSATDANGRLRPTGDILTDIIKKFETMTDRTLKVGVAMQVFGRGGASIIPLLEKGSKAVHEFRAQAEQLGVAFDENTLSAAKQFRGELAQIKAGAEGAAVQFTAGLLPALNEVISALTRVDGKTSAMRSFGEIVGDAFKTAAGWGESLAFYITRAEILWEKLAAKMQKPGIVNTPAGLIGKLIFPNVDGRTPEDLEKELQELEARHSQFQSRLNQPATIKTEKDGQGTPGLNPEKNNYAAEEIAKLREKTQGTLALAAAEMFGLQSVRATTAANHADAIILQIATKASKEHKTALDAEIAAAQKKYGTTVLALTTLDQEAELQKGLNKSIADQTRSAEISIDANRRLAEAIMQGGSAITNAAIANQIDALRRKDGIKLTEEQEAALKKLEDTQQIAASMALDEVFNRETVSLTNAARATQLLINALGKGAEAEIQARAQIEAENFALRNNIDLTDARIKKKQEEIAANLRASQSLSVGGRIQSQYDPTGQYRRSIEEIDRAVKDQTITEEQAAAARRDAYEKEQEDIDRVAMATRRGAAGAAVALREWLRNTRNWAQNMHETVNTVMQGFDTGFRNAFSDVIMGTKSVGQAFAEMGKTMLRSVVDALGNIIAKWIETKIILATLKLFGIDPGTDDPMAKAQAQIQANAAEAESYAGLAAAEEFEYQIAQTGNIFAAAALGAVAYGVGASFAALAAFDNGGIMGKTGLALVHQDEGVLTGPTTKMLVNVNKMMSSGSNQKSAAGDGGHSFHFENHFHNATDPEAVATLSAAKAVKEVKRYFRTAGVGR
jgi:hypothetical protein